MHALQFAQWRSHQIPLKKHNFSELFRYLRRNYHMKKDLFVIDKLQELLSDIIIRPLLLLLLGT